MLLLSVIKWALDFFLVAEFEYLYWVEFRKRQAFLKRERKRLVGRFYYVLVSLEIYVLIYMFIIFSSFLWYIHGDISNNSHIKIIELKESTVKAETLL